MPRISPLDWRLARKVHRFLTRLLPVSRDLPSARNELRWLQEHAKATCTNRANRIHRLGQLVSQRSRHVPLQYILGSEFFGELEIKCHPKVLIPRQETAALVSHLAQLVSQRGSNISFPSKLRVLDLCTGTGCIPLLFHHEFYQTPANASVLIDCVGVDIERAAVSLSESNHAIQQEINRNSINDDSNRDLSLRNMRFVKADVLSVERERNPTSVLSVLAALPHLNQAEESHPTFEILISNPPYISSAGYLSTTSRSVRLHEPKLALVPPTLNRSGKTSSSDVCDGDLFYPRLLDIAEKVNAKVVLFEVGDMDQAIRVATLACKQSIWSEVEIWRDDPAVGHEDQIAIGRAKVKILGSGHGRSVFMYRGEAVDWFSRL